MTLIDRTNGRKYQLVKRWDPKGKFMELPSQRRYSLHKIYI